MEAILRRIMFALLDLAILLTFIGALLGSAYALCVVIVGVLLFIFTL